MGFYQPMSLIIKMWLKTFGMTGLLGDAVSKTPARLITSAKRFETAKRI